MPKRTLTPLRRQCTHCKCNCYPPPKPPANEIRPFTLIALETRAWTGVGNNMRHPLRGSANVSLTRQSAPVYADGHDSLAVRSPTPREISNGVHFQSGNTPNTAGLTDMFWLWGQFVDHELDLTPDDSGEPANMTTPANDPVLANATIPFNRSRYTHDANNVRQQPNIITSFMDASNVYGSDQTRAMALRTLDGTGKLKLAPGPNGESLLIKNTAGLPNATVPHNAPPADFFLAGDLRANENSLLTAMHTLFTREHNYWCDRIIAWRPEYAGKDEPVYQQARRIVAGLEQVITYNEFLPRLLGSLPAFAGYDPAADATIQTEFSTVGYRIGHTMVSSELNTNAEGTQQTLLRGLFFTPSYIDTNGIEGVLVGASKKRMQEIDCRIVDDLRNFLFQAPGGGTLVDLASLNLQRGRDHGITDYNSLRTAYGLAPKANFSEISSNSDVVTRLTNTFTSISDVDPWTGGLCEDHFGGGQVGELFHAIISRQFLNLRAGDRFWFENDPSLSDTLKAEIRQTRLSDIIKRNLQHVDPALVPSDVFKI